MSSGERRVHHWRQDQRSGWAEHLRRSRTSRPIPIISSEHPQTEARQAVALSSMWLFKEVFEIWGPQSLLSVFVLSKVSQQGHDFVFKYFWGWFCFCKRRMGKKNYVGQSVVSYKNLETRNSGLGQKPQWIHRAAPFFL